MATDIFFHVGMSKTGSTYLQHAFFPKLEGLRYLPTRLYKKRYKDFILKNEGNRVLVSREFDRQMEEEVQKFAAHFRNVHPILVLRQQDGWLASQYRRHVKNGGNLSIEEYLDLANNQGEYSIQQLYFYPYIEILEKYFDHKPLVILYDDFRNNTYASLDKIATYTGCTYQKERVSTQAVHPSYSEKQLKILKKVSKRIFPKDMKFYNFLQYRSVWLLCHLVLYTAKLIPNRFVPDTPLVDKAYLQRVKDFYSEDWQRCVTYANT